MLYLLNEIGTAFALLCIGDHFHSLEQLYLLQPVVKVC